jgi:hypothetical protein
VFAEAEQSAVPTAVDKRVGTVACKGDRATPDIAVNTTRRLRRDLESSAYSFKSRGGERASTCLKGEVNAVERREKDLWKNPGLEAFSRHIRCMCRQAPQQSVGRVEKDHVVISQTARQQRDAYLVLVALRYK